jgi:hypothetical protein
MTFGWTCQGKTPITPKSKKSQFSDLAKSAGIQAPEKKIGAWNACGSELQAFGLSPRERTKIKDTISLSPQASWISAGHHLKIVASRSFHGFSDPWYPCATAFLGIMDQVRQWFGHGEFVSIFPRISMIHVNPGSRSKSFVAHRGCFSRTRAHFPFLSHSFRIRKKRSAGHRDEVISTHANKTIYLVQPRHHGIADQNA